ncbi:MAG: stage II sporulation protein M [Myxococcota bacterium]|nr:stage II sporulation protein M [Myxococcota bacterium]
MDAFRNFRGTETIIVEQIYGGKNPRSWQVFVASVAFACLAIGASRRIFDHAQGAISIFLCVLGLMPTLANLMDFRAQRRGWENEGLAPPMGGRTSRNLAISILALFSGVMLTYGAWVLLLPVEESTSAFNTQLSPWLGMAEPGFHAGSFPGILANNLLVGLGILILTLLYRNGGALLVLCWNASVWGAAFAYFARLQFGDGGAAIGGWLALSAAVFPHVLLEATGYVLMVLVGMFALRIIVRYRDPALDRASLLRGTTRLFGLGLVVLIVAALVETVLAPGLVEGLSGGRG